MHFVRRCKFDLRVYVLVTGVDPLKIYVYDEGLVRSDIYNVVKEEILSIQNVKLSGLPLTTLLLIQTRSKTIGYM